MSLGAWQWAIHLRKPPCEGALQRRNCPCPPDSDTRSGMAPRTCPALDADDVLQSLSDDLLSFGDLQQALAQHDAARHFARPTATARTGCATCSSACASNDASSSNASNLSSGLRRHPAPARRNSRPGARHPRRSVGRSRPASGSPPSAALQASSSPVTRVRGGQPKGQAGLSLRKVSRPASKRLRGNPPTPHRPPPTKRWSGSRKLCANDSNASRIRSTSYPRTPPARSRNCRSTSSRTTRRGRSTRNCWSS